MRQRCLLQNSQHSFTWMSACIDWLANGGGSPQRGDDNNGTSDMTTNTWQKGTFGYPNQLGDRLVCGGQVGIFLDYAVQSDCEGDAAWLQHNTPTCANGEGSTTGSRTSNCCLSTGSNRVAASRGGARGGGHGRCSGNGSYRGGWPSRDERRRLYRWSQSCAVFGSCSRSKIVLERRGRLSTSSSSSRSKLCTSGAAAPLLTNAERLRAVVAGKQHWEREFEGV